MKHVLQNTAAVVALLALPLLASAQDVGDLKPSLHPIGGGSVVDTFHAVFSTSCGYPTLDPRRAPEIEREPPDSTINTVEEITITYFVEQTICPGVPPPSSGGTATFEIGQLNKGVTAVFHRYVELDASGQPSGNVEYVFLEWAVVSDTPSTAVSGTWFDAEHAGTGVSLSLAPSEEGAPTAVLFLATLDHAGNPVWFTGAGTFEDAVLTVPLTRSTASGDGPIAAEHAGTARFEYLGCGRATFAFDDDDVRFPGPDIATLQQLTTIAGLPSCTPPETTLDLR